MSQTLTIATVKKIAYLARLSENLSDQEAEKYMSQLGAILNYVDELRVVDVAGVNALDGARTCLVNDLREDLGPDNIEEYQRIRQNIINNFSTRQGNLLVVPGIFD